jgi:hypothetical protein
LADDTSAIKDSNSRASTGNAEAAHAVDNQLPTSRRHHVGNAPVG